LLNKKHGKKESKESQETSQKSKKGKERWKKTPQIGLKKTTWL